MPEYGIYLLLILLGVGAVPFIVQRLEGQFQPFRPDILIVSSILLYTCPVVYDSLYLDGWIGYYFGIQESHLLNGIILNTLFLLTFIIGFYISMFVTGRRQARGYVSKVSSPPKWTAYTLVILGISMFLVYVYSEFGSVYGYIFELNRLGRFSSASGNGFLTIGIYIANSGLALVIAILLTRMAMNGGKPRHATEIITLTIYILIYCVFFVLIGDRRQVFSLIMTIVCLYSIIIGLKAGVWRYILAACIFIIPFQIFSKARKYSSSPLEMIDFIQNNFDTSWLNLSSGELGYSLFVTSKIFAENIDYMHGRTYLDVLVNFVPRFIYPDRPLAPTQWFAQSFYPIAYQQGGSMGFSSVAEGYMNLGYVGVTISGFVFGVAMYWWYRKLISKRDSVYKIAIYAASVPFMFTYIRMDTASLVKIILFSSIIPISMLWAVAGVKHIVSRTSLVPSTAHRTRVT